MAHENLIKKYGITREELNKGISVVGEKLGDICNATVLFAVSELLAQGDIQEDKTNG